MNNQPSPEIFVNSPDGNQHNENKMPKQSTLLPTIAAAITLVLSLFAPLPILIIFMIAASALIAKAFSVKGTFIPLLSFLPAVFIAVFAGNPIAAIFPLISLLCGIALYLSVKAGLNKTLAVISSSSVIIFIFIILFTAFMIFTYDGIGADELSAFFDDCSKYFTAYIEGYIKELETAIDALPEANKDMYLKMFDEVKELYADPEALIAPFYSFIPALLICCANIFSYFAALLYFSFIKEGSGHRVCTTREKAQLKIAFPGVIIFSLSFLLLILGGLSSAVGFIGMNFVLIYTPALCVLGIKAAVNPESRMRNMLLIIAAVVMFFINPIFSLILIAFIGANTVLTNTFIEFLKKRGADIDKDRK